MYHFSCREPPSSKTLVEEREPAKGFAFGCIKLTLLGEEIAGHFIKWWVKKNIPSLGEVLKQTDAVYNSLVKLKRDSENLSVKSAATNYEELLTELKNFSDDRNNYNETSIIQYVRF